MYRELDSPHLNPDQNGNPEAEANAEKHGSLFGGALTDEVLDSSRKVLTKHRGRGALVGTQQFFTPLSASQLIAAVFGRPQAVLDPTAGSGALLAPYPMESRYGIEIDRDHTRPRDDGSGTKSSPYHAITADVQAVVPMLRAAGMRFPALALNPPFGLTWRDPIHGRGEINSTTLAFLWAMDLLDHSGQGAMVCGRDRFRKEVLGRKEAAGVYAIVDVEGPLFKDVELPTSIVFFVRPENREATGQPKYGSDNPPPPPAEFSARREDLPDLALRIVDHRSRSTRHVSHMTHIGSSELSASFTAIGIERERRDKDARAKRAANRYDFTLKGRKVGVGLSAYARITLAKESTLREMELLANQHVSYFAQNRRSWKKIVELRDKGLITVDPGLEDRVASVLKDAEKIGTPLFPVRPQMRLGWLTDLDRIPCKKDDPERNFEAGKEYKLSTHSKVVSQFEERLVERKDGTQEPRKFEKQRKLLAIDISDHEDGKVQHVFNESNENIEYLINHFEIPDPGCVGSRFPEIVNDRRHLLKHLAKKNGFEWRLFQLDHMSRLLVKERGMLAHEQGLGKCVSPDTPVLINGTLINAEKAWARFAADETRFDGEGEWSEPTVELFTTALDSGGAAHCTPIRRLYRQKVREPGRRITLDDGSSITVTNQHKLLGPEGWTLDVEAGDRLCVPRTIEWEGSSENPQLVELLAWQIAEGYENPHKPLVTITQKDPGRLARLRDLAGDFGDLCDLEMNSMPITTPQERSSYLTIWSKHYKDCLEDEYSYEWGRKSASKTIPDKIIAADNKTLRVFLRAFLAAEAHVNTEQRIVELTSASQKLMHQISLMLRRFGIWLRISKKTKSATNGLRVARDYYTGIIGGESLRLLQQLVGIDDGSKAAKLNQIAAVAPNSNVGGIPVADLIQEARTLTKLPWLHLTTSRAYAFEPGGASPTAAREISARIRTAASEGAAGQWRGPQGKPAKPGTIEAYENLDRQALLAIADRLDERIARAVRYARVVSVQTTYLDGYVYDFEVPEHHNYVAGGMMAHNTLMLMGLTEATIKLGAEDRALYVVPQDLIRQWQRESKKFFGNRIEIISNPQEAKDVERRIAAGETGRWITYYEAMSTVGRKRELLPHIPLFPKMHLERRLDQYKYKKKEGITRNPVEVRPLPNYEEVPKNLFSFAPLSPARRGASGSKSVFGNGAGTRNAKPKDADESLVPDDPYQDYALADAQDEAQEDAYADVDLQFATTLIACPKCGATTYEGWDGEACHTEKRCVTHGPFKKVKSCPENGAGCVVKGCNYTHRSRYAKSSYTHLTRAFKGGVLSIDEVSEIRGDDSLRSKSIRALSSGPHIYGATGTPLSNFIADSFWGLLVTLGASSPAFPYAHIGGKVKFEDDFCVQEFMKGREEDGEEHLNKRKRLLPEITNVSQFWHMAQAGVSRCRKEQTGEPLVPRTYLPIEVPMGVEQRKSHYFWLANFSRYFLWKHPNHPLVQGGLVDKWAAALGQLWHLERAATLPASEEAIHEWPVARAEIGDVSNWTPANLKVLELAMKHAAKGEKILIGSDLIMTGRWIADRLREKGIRAVHITEETGTGENRKVTTKNPRKRSREVEAFVEGDAQVLCAGVNAMKLGHNLDVASTVISHGLPYSFMAIDQFIARVHRLTSKNPVSVYVILPKNSLAERKWNLLKDKGSVSDLAYDGELQVQPEKPVDWNKVLKEMRQSGIRATGNEVHEEDIEAQWRNIPAVSYMSATRIRTARGNSKNGRNGGNTGKDLSGPAILAPTGTSDEGYVEVSLF